MEIKEIETIQNWKELEEDKEYNRYVMKSTTGIDTTTIRKILYFKQEDIYIIYINETLREALLRWQMIHKHNNS